MSNLCAPIPERVIFALIREYVRPGFAREVVGEAELETDLGLDDLDRESIALDCDEAFDIEITDAELEGWQTAFDVVVTVSRLLAGAER